jgi:predicted YcjX-like family ATPase
MAFDFDFPQFSTHELLACVPGLSNEALKQWVNREVVALSYRESSTSGRPAVHSGADVIQVATIRELTRQGIMAHVAKEIWRVVGTRIDQIRDGNIGEGDVATFFRVDHDGSLHIDSFRENNFEPADLDQNKDGTNVQVFFRVDRFIREMVSRMETVIANRPPPRIATGKFTMPLPIVKGHG